MLGLNTRKVGLVSPKTVRSCRSQPGRVMGHVLTSVAVDETQAHATRTGSCRVEIRDVAGQASGASRNGTGTPIKVELEHSAMILRLSHFFVGLMIRSLGRPRSHSPVASRLASW